MENVLIDIEVIKKCKANSDGTVDNKPRIFLDVGLMPKENIGVVIPLATYVNNDHSNVVENTYFCLYVTILALQRTS